MDYKKVFWGVIFILIGLLFVLKNLNILDFSWYQFIDLWPLLLILWGIAMLPIKSIVKVLLSLVVVVLGVYLVTRYSSDSWHWRTIPRQRHYEYRDRSERREFRKDREEEREKGIDESATQYLFFPYSEDMEKVTLKLEAAAGRFAIMPVSQHLIEVRKDGNIGNYSLTSEISGDRHIVKLTMEDGSFQGSRFRNNVDIKLNQFPIWDLDLDIGAARIDIDLSPFKTNNIKIDGGASAIRLKVGDLQPKIDVEVNAGASSIVIEVPRNSGCRVKTSTILSGKNMRDFISKESGVYETDNFFESENKINIKVDVAVSSIEIRRY